MSQSLRHFGWRRQKYREHYLQHQPAREAATDDDMRFIWTAARNEPGLAETCVGSVKRESQRFAGCTNLSRLVYVPVGNPQASTDTLEDMDRLAAILGGAACPCPLRNRDTQVLEARHALLGEDAPPPRLQVAKSRAHGHLVRSIHFAHCPIHQDLQLDRVSPCQ